MPDADQSDPQEAGVGQAAPPARVSGESQWVLTAIDNLDKRLDRRLDSLDERLDRRLDGLDSRLRSVEAKLTRYSAIGGAIVFLLTAVLVASRFFDFSVSLR